MVEHTSAHKQRQPAFISRMPIAIWQVDPGAVVCAQRKEIFSTTLTSLQTADGAVHDCAHTHEIKARMSMRRGDVDACNRLASMNKKKRAMKNILLSVVPHFRESIATADEFRHHTYTYNMIKIANTKHSINPDQISI